MKIKMNGKSIGTLTSFTYEWQAKRKGSTTQGGFRTKSEAVAWLKAAVCTDKRSPT